MNKDDWCSLPPAVALGILFDMVPGLATIPKPQFARSPRYDDRLSRKGGYVWMSEMNLSSLEWWLAKKRESVASGGSYAAKDEKTVAKLEKWVAWRKTDPDSRWQGTRGDDRVTAQAPADQPAVNEWDNRGSGRPRSEPPPPQDEFGGANDTDDIPFILDVTCDAEERWWKRSLAGLAPR